MPSRLIAPAPAASQGHLPGPAKVPGHITVTLESSMPPASIPVATISSQQVGPIHSALSNSGKFFIYSVCSGDDGQCSYFAFLQGQSNLHHLMAANLQIIRSSTPALQISSPTAPPHPFTSHLPRGELKYSYIQNVLLWVTVYGYKI